MWVCITQNYCTESHIIWDQKGPLEIVKSNPSLREGCSGPHPVQFSLTCLGNLFHCLITQLKKNLHTHTHTLISKWNFLFFSWCPLPFVLSLGTTEKPEFVFLTPLPISSLYTWIRSIINLLFSRLKGPHSHSLFLYERCSNPLTIFRALWWTYSNMSTSILYWRVHNWANYSRFSLFNSAE